MSLEDLGSKVLSTSAVSHLVGGFMGAVRARRQNHAREITGAGSLYVSKDDVLAAAAKFDSDLRNFIVEIDDNPVFAERRYSMESNPKAAAKMESDVRKAHQALVTNLSGVVFDWDGVTDAELVKKEEWGKVTPEDLGYYRTLKKMWSAGSNELEIVQSFHERLRELRSQYEKLGYKLYTKQTDKPGLEGLPWKWILGTVAALGAAYVGYTIWKGVQITRTVSSLSGVAARLAPPMTVPMSGPVTEPTGPGSHIPSRGPARTLITGHV